MTNVLSIQRFKLSRIAQLNDDFRKTFRGGKVVFTNLVSSLAPDEILMVVNKVRNFSEFTEDNDPYGEHDFGAFEHNGTRFFFKIDYYDKTMAFGSEDPANPEKTTRVLTVMIAEEY
jgi:hypothetical protein